MQLSRKSFTDEYNKIYMYKSLDQVFTGQLYEIDDLGTNFEIAGIESRLEIELRNGSDRYKYTK